MAKSRSHYYYILYSHLILFLIFFMQTLTAQKGVLTGRISNLEGTKLAYAGVFNTSTLSGTVSNVDGYYSLGLNYGTNIIEFSFLGFKRQSHTIDIHSDTTVLNISLEKESYLLQEVVVGLKEDPAYEMIRQAIKAREGNLVKTGTFEATIYSKGIYRLEHVSDSAFGKALFDSVHTKEEALGIIYLSEAESKFSLQHPGNLKEEIVSSRVSGDSKGFSFNFTSFININLYRNLVRIPFDFSHRGFVSPISNNAMMYYRYRLVGSFLDGDYLVHKIELRPKRKIDRVFHGYLYLIEGLWCVHSTNLIITEDAEIDFIDSIRISQEYKAVNDSTWAMQTQNYDFDFFFNLFGIEAGFNGHYLVVYKKYNWQPEFDDNYFDDEIFRIDMESNKKDSSYWEENRPVPLSSEEEENYIEFDSLEQKYSSKEYLDSIDREHNKFRIWRYINKGYTFNNSFRDREAGIGSPFTNIAFNTVQGFTIKLPLKFKQEFEHREYFKQYLEFGYGFSNELFDFDSHSEYYYNRNKFASLKLNFGITHTQYNNRNPILPTINGIYSLFMEQNYMKLYREKYLKVAHQSEIFNGFQLSGKLEFADRAALSNESQYSFRDVPDREYSSNNVWINADGNPYFKNHQAFMVSFNVFYSIDQKYASLPYKTSLGSKYPPLGFTYKKAFPGIFRSDADFDFFKIYTHYNYSIGLIGESRMKFSYGRFLRNKEVHFPDYFHFDGNKTIIYLQGTNDFHMLDYYSYSTIDDYFEAHFQHHFNGFIINKIPWVRKSKFRVVTGLHYLFQDVGKQYLELTIGIKNIGKLGRIDFVTAYDQGKKLMPGITIGFGM